MTVSPVKPQVFQPVSKNSFRAAMSLVPQSVFIVTTDGIEGRAGLTATSVTSVSAEPPCLLICLNSTNASTSAFLANKNIAVNCLNAEQIPLAELFSSSKKHFSDEHWQFASSPILRDSRCSFECKIIKIDQVNTHMIIFAEVVNLLTYEFDKALIYVERNYRTV